MADQGTERNSSSLKVIADCEGCGVCCLHMGYPVFQLPREPLTESQIRSDAKLSSEVEKDPRRLDELLAGYPGESYWHALPEALRQQWFDYINDYQLPEYGDDPSTFDGPCVWYNPATRQCKNHEYRPRVCREFETGSKQCYEWREFYQAKLKINVSAHQASRTRPGL
tara:strand:- start:157 stop:660 length:504 start_codon:yes stop_codon:yes gene_type:complete